MHPEGSHPGHRQVGPGGRAAPPGRVKAKACLDPTPGRAHARGVRDAAAPADGGAENGRHIFGKEVEDGGELGAQMGHRQALLRPRLIWAR